MPYKAKVLLQVAQAAARGKSPRVSTSSVPRGQACLSTGRTPWLQAAILSCTLTLNAAARCHHAEGRQQVQFLPQAWAQAVPAASSASEDLWCVCLAAHAPAACAPAACLGPMLIALQARALYVSCMPPALLGAGAEQCRLHRLQGAARGRH